jgi:LmbE family N-acetylglucosaminyl deacetylase
LDIKERRKSEARVSLGILGVAWDHVTMLEAVDGTLASLPNPEARAIEDLLTAVIQRTVPDAVFLPCREDGSSEHDATFLLVQSALRLSGKSPRILEFPVWAWHNPLRLLEPMVKSRKVWRSLFSELNGTKLAAISSYATQIHPIPPENTPVLPPYFVAEHSLPVEFFFEE